jgi:spore coat polysaccharide biosynthesis protein SpsF
MKNKITAIIFARMRSTRLPRKVLMPLNRKSSLWWMTNRCLNSKYINDVIIATTSHPANKPINEHIDYFFKNSDKVKVFNYMGGENDVMGRMIAAATENDTDVIVDLTSDCPLVDSSHIDFLIEMLLNNDIDYAANCIDRSFPDGLDIQVYYTEVLKECKKIFAPLHHVGINIGHNPEYFNVLNWVAPKNMYFPDWGLTLDTPEDYQLLKIIFDKFGCDVFFKVEDVVKYINENSELLEINSSIKRKEIWEG